MRGERFLVGAAGEVEVVRLQVQCEDVEVFRRSGLAGGGGEAVLEGIGGHFPVDDEDAAGCGGAPAEAVPASGDGVGEMRLADAARAVQQREAAFGQPGGEEVAARGDVQGEEFWEREWRVAGLGWIGH